MNQTLWDDINEPFGNEMQAVLGNCQQILESGFDASQQDRVEFCKRFEEDIRDYTKEQMKKLF